MFLTNPDIVILLILENICKPIAKYLTVLVFYINESIATLHMIYNCILVKIISLIG